MRKKFYDIDKPIYKCETIKGNFGIVLNQELIKKILFPGYWNEAESLSGSQSATVIKLKIDFDKYFSGENIDWGKKYALDIENTTPFRKKVWTVLQEIPYGKTMSYSEIASILNIKGCRAIGNACHYNNIPILIPCHRVISKNGNLCGFGAGLEWKEFLLNLEKHI